MCPDVSCSPDVVSGHSGKLWVEILLCGFFFFLFLLLMSRRLIWPHQCQNNQRASSELNSGKFLMIFSRTEGGFSNMILKGYQIFTTTTDIFRNKSVADIFYLQDWIYFQQIFLVDFRLSDLGHVSGLITHVCSGPDWASDWVLTGLEIIMQVSRTEGKEMNHSFHFHFVSKIRPELTTHLSLFISTLTCMSISFCISIYLNFFVCFIDLFSFSFSSDMWRSTEAVTFPFSHPVKVMLLIRLGSVRLQTGVTSCYKWTWEGSAAHKVLSTPVTDIYNYCI